MVFEEINPQALTLMTDVFGNYVIQKVLKMLTFSDSRQIIALVYIRHGFSGFQASDVWYLIFSFLSMDLCPRKENWLASFLGMC